MTWLAECSAVHASYQEMEDRSAEGHRVLRCARHVKAVTEAWPGMIALLRLQWTPERVPESKLPPAARQVLKLLEAEPEISSPALRRLLGQWQQHVVSRRRGQQKAKQTKFPAAVMPEVMIVNKRPKMPPPPGKPALTLPLVLPAPRPSVNTCGTCQCILAPFICEDCRRHVCPRCGTCSTRCSTRLRRRELKQFSAFQESTIGFVPEDEWRQRMRQSKEGVGHFLERKA